MERDIFKGVNSIKFYKRFDSDDSCYKYLSDVKWGGDTFVCKKCGNTHYCKGRSPYSRRCTRCKYDESATSGTMFDKCKFPILLAFHIAFKISTKKKGMSSLELSEEYELRQKTCWEFKWKIQQAMKSSGNYLLTGEVHVDEFYVGGEEEGVVGRSAEAKKKLVVVALEIVSGGVGRAYAQVIDDASARSLRSFFSRYISKDATIITDEWNGYKPLAHDYNIEQRKSDDGKTFPQLHIHIMNIKGWLRGIHHHCSKERMQGYLDEYHFRFNRRNQMDTIFDVLVRRMVFNKPTRI
ncbi:MAG: IS1595 family transposase [Bacteroidaceae bacterium]|nr:IS1595 family transposase [Bacteroidaceae bacterium]